MGSLVLFLSLTEAYVAILMRHSSKGWSGQAVLQDSRKDIASG